MVEPILRAERGLARGKGWKGCSLPGRWNNTGKGTEEGSWPRQGYLCAVRPCSYCFPFAITSYIIEGIDLPRWCLSANEKTWIHLDTWTQDRCTGKSRFWEWSPHARFKPQLLLSLNDCTASKLNNHTGAASWNLSHSQNFANITANEE
jgi:hypothetical protein